MSIHKKASRWAAVVACSAALGLVTAGGCMSGDKTSPEAKQMMMSSDRDIIETATGPNMEQVTTLVKAVQAAGLVDTLKASGPYTVFAPTNDAFAALPAGTLDSLLKPENKDKLKAILLYHVHKGDAIMAKDASTMGLSSCDDGKMIAVSVRDGTVMVNDAKVIKPDIVCKNGVIHWIDRVIMPPGM